MSRLFEASLDQLEDRLAELDEWARASDEQSLDVQEIRQRVFALGDDPLDDWNDYHRVRSEYERRAAEEFDLGQ